MSSLELKTYPDSCLRIKTKTVESFTPDFGRILRSMADFMYVNRGIGLAATQIGLDISVIVVDAGDGLISLVNPVILDISKQKDTMEEGCLSLPDLTVNVTRPEKVKIRAQNNTGEFFEAEYDGLLAKAVQHEMDHLSGKLIIDYLGLIRRFIVAKKLRWAKHGSNKPACEVVCDGN